MSLQEVTEELERLRNKLKVAEYAINKAYGALHADISPVEEGEEVTKYTVKDALTGSSIDDHIQVWGRTVDILGEYLVPDGTTDTKIVEPSMEGINKVIQEHLDLDGE